MDDTRINPIKIIVEARECTPSVTLSLEELVQLTSSNELNPIDRNVWFLLSSLTAQDPQLTCESSYGLLAEKLNTTPPEVYQAIARLCALDFVKVSPDDGHLSYIFQPVMPSFLTSILEKEIDFQLDNAIGRDAFVEATQQIFRFTLHMPLKGLLALKKATILSSTDKRVFLLKII